LLVREPMSEHNASPSSHAFLVDIGHHQLKNPILRQSLEYTVWARRKAI